MRVVYWLVAAFALTLGIGFYLTYSAGFASRPLAKFASSTDPLAKAEDLLRHGELEEVLELVGHRLRMAEEGELLSTEWLNLALRAYGEEGEPYQLVALYQQYPDAFRAHEVASLTVARVALFTGDFTTYTAIRKQWRNRQNKIAQWRLLDVDRMILLGQTKEAEKLLASWQFDGTDEADRLIRVAKLAASRDQREAWAILQQAQQKEPEYAELYVWRGRLAEQAGDLLLAQGEYLRAVQLRPRSIMMRDQLAEFYRRYHQYKLALSTWAEGLQSPSADVVWLKTLFWSRVAFPVNVDWDALEPPVGSYSPLVDYLLDLPDGRYWDASSFAALSDRAAYALQRQETFWLRLLQLLKDGRETDAATLLADNPFSQRSWDPDLELQLRRVLAYRLNGSLTVEGQQPNSRRDESRHAFLRDLDRYGTSEAKSLPSKLKVLLESEDAVAALFMAAGWSEAALQLRTLAHYPPGFPDWVAFGFTQCLRQNRGDEMALSFAQRQTETEALALVIGELQASTGDPDTALDNFLRLLKVGSEEVSIRAGWLAANLLIKQKQLDQAEEIVERHPSFRRDLLGRELLARIAMLKGETSRADTLYAELENESIEAKSYLARRAFEEKDWSKAQALTEELLEKQPAHPMLRENLRRIEEASK